MLGFLILMVVAVGATALAVGAALGILLILFHLMRTAVLGPQMRSTTFSRAGLTKAHSLNG